MSHGWAITHFESMQSLFFKVQNSAIWKFAHFSHIFAHFLFLKQRCAIPHFVAHLKNAKKVQSHNCIFEKSHQKV